MHEMNRSTRTGNSFLPIHFEAGRAHIDMCVPFLRFVSTVHFTIMIMIMAGKDRAPTDVAIVKSPGCGPERCVGRSHGRLYNVHMVVLLVVAVLVVVTSILCEQL